MADSVRADDETPPVAQTGLLFFGREPGVYLRGSDALSASVTIARVLRDGGTGDDRIALGRLAETLAGRGGPLQQLKPFVECQPDVAPPAIARASEPTCTIPRHVLPGSSPALKHANRAHERLDALVRRLGIEFPELDLSEAR